MRFCFNSLVISLSCAFMATAHAENDPLQLTPSRTVSDFAQTSPAKEGQAPVVITADHLEGSQGKQIEAIGAVEVHHSDQAIFADHVLFQQDSKDLVADGNVRVEQVGNVMTGLRNQLKEARGN